MEFRQFGPKYILRIDKGEEVVETLSQFCKENKIKLGSVSGLGATDKLTIGLFSVKEKQYYKKELTGDFEITNLTGNISTKDGEVYLHLHITVSDEKYNAYGGHLNACWISGTCELIIEAIDGQMDRKFSEEIGLNLYKF